MSKPITGYRKETIKSLTTGAGVAFENFDLATDTYETGNKLGATTGGVKIKIEFPDAWDREIDGLPTNAIGLHENELVKPTLTAAFVEVSNASTIARALGAAKVEAANAPTGYTKVTPDPVIADSHYLENIVVFTQTKVGEPLIIEIKNPLSTDGFEFATEGKAGGSIEINYTGNFDPMNLDECPISFYVPTSAE